jgi:chemotaxis response regulator CheB
MPKGAIELGAAEKVVSLSDVIQTLINFAQRESRGAKPPDSLVNTLRAKGE